MQTKFTKEKYRLVLSQAAKRRLWLTLPYRLRLKIEHFSYVANVITNSEKQISLTVFQKLFSMPVYRKIAPLYKELRKLNNPYVPSINAPVSDKAAEARINNFLSRFTNA